MGDLPPDPFKQNSGDIHWTAKAFILSVFVILVLGLLNMFCEWAFDASVRF
jgi:hypothetical protein